MKNYNGTTRTLEEGKTGFKNVIFKPGKPPLDSELNFVGDLAEGLSKKQLELLHNSGFFTNPSIYSTGYDNSGTNFGINLTTSPNLLIFKNPHNVPMGVNILGDVVMLGGSNCTNASQAFVTLPPPPGSGSREDLVFLEVWYQQIVSQSYTNRPVVGIKNAQLVVGQLYQIASLGTSTNADWAAIGVIGTPTVGLTFTASATGAGSGTGTVTTNSQVYAYGNIQSGLPTVPDNIYYSLINTQTTDRIQVQYSIRVVPGVNFGVYPDGINDNSTVFGQAAMPLQSTYGYAPHPTDAGLYVAGDGSPSAQTALGSDDGYVYAIPLVRVHRRNAAPFSLSNLNGAGRSVAQGNSDRPDGYFNDKIEIGDIEDLRHSIAPDFNPREILELNFDALLRGQLGTALVESDNSLDVVTSANAIQVDQVSVVTNTGTSDVATPNDQRRVVSDAPTAQETIQSFSLAQRSFGSGPNWSMNDQLTVSLALQSPVGTVLAPNPVVTALVPGGPVDAVVVIPVAVNYLTNDYVITLGAIPAGVTTQNLNVTFDVLYPPGVGLTYVPTNVLKVYEISENVNYSFTTAGNPVRPGSLVPSSGVATDYAIGLDAQKAFTTLYQFTVTGNGTSAYTIPAALGGVPITHIYEYQIDGGFVSRTVGGIKVLNVVFTGSNTIQVTFNGAVASTSTITFFVALSNNAVLIDSQVKGLNEVTESVYLKQTVNSGNNKTQVIFDAGSLVYAAQAAMNNSVDAPGNKQNYVFINGTETPCTVVLQDNYVIVTLATPIGSLTNDTIQIAITRAKTLNVSDQLQIYYQHTPYQGITSRVSFNKGPNSFVNTYVTDKAIGFLVHTSGTGGHNTSVNGAYSPISVKLPMIPSQNDGLLQNNPIAAPIFPTHEGVDPNADFTIGGTIGYDLFETYHDWYDEGFDTEVSVDDLKTMFLRDTVRVNKVGIGFPTAYCSKDTIIQDWSTVIDAAGNLLNGKKLVYWFYAPNPSVMVDVELHLATDTSGTNDHIYLAGGQFVVGWNRVEFVSRTGGTATTNHIVKVQFRFVTSTNTITLYGMNVVPPYLENIAFEAPPILDQDLWYSQSESTLVKFDILRGMYAVSDGVGIEWFGDKAYSFEIPVVSGAPVGTPSLNNTPYVLGKQNFLSKVGVVNNRGTFIGSNFYSVGMSTLTNKPTQTVMYMLEQVIQDPTGNFAPGEYVLRVETRINNNRVVKITNSNFDNLNAFELYRCRGRPLGKV